MKSFLFFCTGLIFTITVTAQNLTPFRSASKLWGYKDASGKVVIPPRYEFEAHNFSNGVAIVRNSGLKGYGVIDAKGNEIVPPQYNYAFDFVNGLAKVCVGGTDIYGTGGKWGFIDTKGKVVIPIQYERIDGMFDGDSFASATLNGKRIIIDKTGTQIKFTNCDELYGTFYKSNLAIAIKDKKYGFVDRTGKVIIPFEYEQVYGFDYGLSCVKKDGLWGFINEKNQWVIKPQFTSGSYFYNGYAIMHKDYKFYGTIDRTGKFIISQEYNNMYPQSKITTPTVVVKKGDKVGLMNPVTGKEIAPLKYDEIQDFKEGLMVVKIGSKYGFIDPTGKEVVIPQYEYASSFYDGLAYVKMGNKYGFIDNSGKVVIPIQYKFVSEFQGGISYVTNMDGKASFIDKKGNEVKE